MTVALLLAVLGTLSGTASAQTAAPDGPGVLSRFDLARKDCLGTAANRGSKVWYTVAGGVLSDVYSPTIDNTNVESLRYIVTDGSTFTDVQGRDTTYSVRTTDTGGMVCEVTTTASSGRWRLVTEYVTDAVRNSVVMRNRLEALQGSLTDLQLYVRYDATVNGNGGGGTPNGGADSAIVDAATTALVSYDTSTESQALNRDYGVPLYGALRANRAFTQTTSGFAGSSSDGLLQLDSARTLSETFEEALAATSRRRRRSTWDALGRSRWRWATARRRRPPSGQRDAVQHCPSCSRAPSTSRRGCDTTLGWIGYRALTS